MENKILEIFAIDFIKNHFDEIDLKSVGWKVKTKESAIKQIKKSQKTLFWVISEVMTWGTGINYLKEFFVQNEDDLFIIKIDERYFYLDYENVHYFKEVFPKKSNNLKA